MYLVSVPRILKLLREPHYFVENLPLYHCYMIQKVILLEISKNLCNGIVQPPSFIKGMKFFKIGYNGGGGGGILHFHPFSNVVHPPNFPVTSNSHLHCPFCCHVSLAEWVIIPHLRCYFT